MKEFWERINKIRKRTVWKKENKTERSCDCRVRENPMGMSDFGKKEKSCDRSGDGLVVLQW